MREQNVTFFQYNFSWLVFNILFFSAAGLTYYRYTSGDDIILWLSLTIFTGICNIIVSKQIIESYLKVFSILKVLRLAGIKRLDYALLIPYYFSQVSVSDKPFEIKSHLKIVDSNKEIQVHINWTGYNNWILTYPSGKVIKSKEKAS